MNRPSQSELLGYLLGALEVNEQKQIEQAIEQDPSLRGELDYLETCLARLAPLESNDGMSDRPSLGLAKRTCESIFALTEPTVEAVHAADEPVKISPSMQLNARVGWSPVDMIFASAVCLLFSLIFIPAIANSRFQSQVTTCQNNLRKIGVGLTLYGGDNGGRLIEIPRSERLGFAGIYAPVLRDLELVSSHNSFFCPSAPQKENMLIPSNEALGMANGESLRNLQQMAGGDYGYVLGYVSDEKYCVPRINEVSHSVILADSPDIIMPGNRSSNHGGRGQNALFGDFSTKYLVSCSIDVSDHIYLNDQGQIGPGSSASDSVIGSSGTSPFASMGYFKSKKQF